MRINQFGNFLVFGLLNIKPINAESLCFVSTFYKYFQNPHQVLKLERKYWFLEFRM